MLASNIVGTARLAWFYVPGPDGQPSFRALPRLKTDEVSDVLQVARVRILRYLARRGVVHLSPEALEIDDELAGA